MRFSTSFKRFKLVVEQKYEKNGNSLSHEMIKRTLKLMGPAKKFCNKDPVWQLSRTFLHQAMRVNVFFQPFQKAGNKKEIHLINFDDI